MQFLFYVYVLFDCVVYGMVVIVIVVFVGYFGLVYCDVVIFQQCGCVGGIVGEQGYIDGGIQEQFFVLYYQWFVQFVYQDFGQVVCGGCDVVIVDQDYEFIVIKVCQQGFVVIGLCYCCVDVLGELQQGFVVGFMVEGVIDVFEVVDVGKQQFELMIGGVCGYQVVIQCFVECQVVGQVG